MKFQLQIIGVPGYEEVRGGLRALIQYVTHDIENMRFYLAVNEAVNNAIRYGKFGLAQTKVEITVRINKRYLAMTICSESVGFNVKHYVARIQKETENMACDWADYFLLTTQGRGIWVILSGTERVYYNEKGTAVTLIGRLPVIEDHRQRDFTLFRKLHVRDE